MASWEGEFSGPPMGETVAAAGAVNAFSARTPPENIAAREYVRRVRELVFSGVRSHAAGRRSSSSPPGAPPRALMVPESPVTVLLAAKVVLPGLGKDVLVLTAPNSSGSQVCGA
ncbi:hypothetical protein GCM10022226_48250 [Sphaerisporangium flaviroseum]|uniref:Uncharacterized protein n=1 Tax=Sphaerisporangium flaviroseum TaxID=509199 RepID=A0ABP7IMR9_9ACTN